MKVRGRLKIWLAMVAGSALLLSACGSSSSSDSSGDATGGSSSDPGVAAAKAALEKAKAVTPFTPPGPAFDASKAQGKTVFYLPNSSTIPLIIDVGKTMKEALAVAGVKQINYTTQGQPSQWAAGIQAAITQHVDAIAMFGVNPLQIKPQLQAAKAAGIPTILFHAAAESNPLYKEEGKLVTVNMPQDYGNAGALMADQAIAATNGAAHVLIVSSPDIPQSADEVSAINNELKKNCPNCTTDTVDVNFAEWSTSITPSLQSALIKNPDANYVLPLYDGMVQWVKPAITAAGKTGKVHVATYNATPFVLDMIRNNDTVTMDVGESDGWLGWGVADQAMREMTGAGAIPNLLIPPQRVFDASNVKEAGEPADITKGYGDGYIAGYKKLWGIS